MEKEQRYIHLPANKKIMKSLDLLKLITAIFSSPEVLTAARLEKKRLPATAKCNLGKRSISCLTCLPAGRYAKNYITNTAEYVFFP